MTLLDQQKERLLTIFNPTKDIFWKVLILDTKTKAIVSPLLKLSELRALGITTYFLIDSSRQKIKDIPAIYFIENTTENIDILKKDVSSGLYCSYFINFSTFISRELLENFAYYVSRSHMGQYVQSVYDQYIDFISLQSSLFTLNMSNCFITYKNKELWKSVTNKIFSVFLTMNTVPFILSMNNESEVCSNIMNMLSQKIASTNVISKTRKRPLLILIDRCFDMMVPIEHPLSYNSLISDLLEFNLNKVSFVKEAKDKSGNIEKIQQSFELNDDDIFWKENQCELFPIVSEKIEKELLLLKKDMAMRSIDDRTDKKMIASILEKAPELSRRNESIKAHMSICLELIKRIKEQAIDEFYRLENSRNIKEDELIEISERGNENDILRLVLKKKGVINEEILKTILNKRKIKDNIFDMYNDSKNEQQLSQNMVSTLIGNVKKLLPVNIEPLISSEVENIFSGIRNGRIFNSNNNKICFKDPITNKTHVYDTEISKLVVIVLGTSCYKEYCGIKNLEKKLGIEIIFGCDEIISPDEFIRQFKKSKDLV